MSDSCTATTIPEATIAVDQLTSGTVDGTGVFDVLMSSVKGHIHGEFTASRIKGTEYATVYLGAIQTVLSESMNFVLQEQLNEKQIELIDHQIETEKGQICKLQAEYDLILAQIGKINAETALITQKKVTEAAQTSDTAISADSVIGKQKDLYAAQTAGYSRDAEQKAAKMVLDIIATQIATAGSAVDPGSALATGNVDSKVLIPLLQNAGLMP